MTITVDSREHEGKNEHVLQYFRDNGIKYINKEKYGNISLTVGDYMNADSAEYSVDRKFGMQEVYSCLMSGHERFRRECARAQTCEIKLIVLVEESGIKCIDDVANWQNPRRTKWFQLNAMHKAEKCLNRVQSKQPPASSETLMKSMKTMSERYGVEWRFCEKADTGRVIVEILSGRDMTEGESV